MSFFKKGVPICLEQWTGTEVLNILLSSPQSICRLYPHKPFAFPVFDPLQVKSLVQLTDLKNTERFLDQLANRLPVPYGVVVATAAHVESVQKYAGFLYLPGDFCRQSDVLTALQKSDKPVAVERGCFLSPLDISFLAQKLVGADWMLVEGGSSFGYGERVLDVRVLHLWNHFVGDQPWALHISQLLSVDSNKSYYEHRNIAFGQWDFLSSFMKIVEAFRATGVVYDAPSTEAMHVLRQAIMPYL